MSTDEFSQSLLEGESQLTLSLVPDSQSDELLFLVRKMASEMAMMPGLVAENAIRRVVGKEKKS